MRVVVWWLLLPLVFMLSNHLLCNVLRAVCTPMLLRRVKKSEEETEVGELEEQEDREKWQMKIFTTEYTQRVAMVTFWRIFHNERNIHQAW